MPKTNYIARLEGKIVGKRSTAARTYTHALVVQSVEEVARKRAYDYTSDDTDSRNFEYYSEIVRLGREHKHLSGAWHSDEYVAAEVAKSQALIDGGFDAYVRRLRERAIASFEKSKADGNFEPFVATWCGRPDLAQKAITQFTSNACKFVAIVAAEEVIDTKKLKTCQPLTDHFNQSLGRKV